MAKITKNNTANTDGANTFTVELSAVEASTLYDVLLWWSDSIPQEDTDRNTFIWVGELMTCLEEEAFTKEESDG